MAFGTGTVVTNTGRSMLIDRLKSNPITFTSGPKMMAMGVGATGANRTAAVTDIALSSEIETRTSGVEQSTTTTVFNDTYEVTGAISASSLRNVDEAGLFDSSNNMFTSATFTPFTLNPGDSINFTWLVQLV